MGLFRRFLAGTHGASAVEFALVVVPFLLLLFGIIEVGRAFWTRQVLADVAIMGARCMGVMQRECIENDSYAAGKTLSFLVDGLRGRGVSVPDENIVLEPDAECDGLPGFSRVTISLQFSSALPLDDVFNFSSVACFPNQQIDD